MSNSTYNLAISIYFVTIRISQITPPFHLTFGTFGNVLNIILFTRPNLRTNPCSIYFIASSINNILFMYLFELINYLSSIWHVYILPKSNFWCKLDIIIGYLPFTLILWFPVLASIDRFLSSSRNIQVRHLSSLKIARRVIVGIYIVFLLLLVHLFIYYELVPTSNNGFDCGVSSEEYFVFFNFFVPILCCILPILLMCIFGILILHNVRSVHVRIVPHANNARNDHIRSNDRHMAKMLLFQILITVIMSLPYIGTTMFYTLAVVKYKYDLSLLQNMIYTCANVIAGLLYYTNSVTGFYIYTMASSKFRKEMKHCIRLGLIKYFPMRIRPILANINPAQPQ
ncbi:hypothetical protein I4U23_011300 [Adineta vaga]|nr:hypothetical protein I4U23_011300 [Adineta vaga]